MRTATVGKLRRAQRGMRWAVTWQSQVMAEPSELRFPTELEAVQFRDRFLAEPPPHQRLPPKRRSA